MRLPALACLLPLLLSCRESQPLVTAEPTNAEVAGRYELSHFTFGDAVDAEIRSKASQAFIELHQDGTVTLSQVPVIPDDEGRPFCIRRFLSGSGTYSISALGSTSESEFYGLLLACGDLPDPMDTPRFRKNGQAMVLSFDYFDGDFTQRMTFSRNGNPPADPAALPGGDQGSN